VDNPYSTPPDKPFRWIRSRRVGGRTLVWDAVTPRFSDFDFKAASRDGFGPDWPLTHGELAPYYSELERFLGVHGSREGLPQLPDGDFLEPRPMTPAERIFKERVERVFPERPVIISRGLSAGRPPARGETLSRISSPATTLRAAQETGYLFEPIIAGAIGGTGDRIFNRGDQQVKPDWKLGLDNQAGEREHMRCAAHVLLHDPHPGSRLQIEPAAVETDALADERNPRIVGLAPFELDQARSTFRRRCASDGCDKRIALGKLSSTGNSKLRAGSIGEVSGGFLKLGRAEVRGGRIDKVPHQRRGLGELHDRFDLRRLLANQDARTAVILCLRSIGIEAMLGEEPAETRQVWISVRELVRSFGQLFSERRKAPGRQLLRILDGSGNLKLVAARKDRECVLGLAVEAMGGKQRAVFDGPLFQPALEAVFVDKMNWARLLAAIGNEERSEVGHAHGCSGEIRSREGEGAMNLAFVATRSLTISPVSPAQGERWKPGFASDGPQLISRPELIN